MVIESYDVKTNSKESNFSVSSLSAARTKVTLQPPEPEEGEEANPAVQLDLSHTSKQMAGQMKNALNDAVSNLKANNAATLAKGSMPSSPEDLKLSLLEMMLYSLTGKHFSFKSADVSMNNSSAETQQRLQAHSMAAFSGNQQRAMQAEQWTFESFNYQSESISYQAQGVVNTADGQSINIDINLSMSQEFMSYSKVSLGVMQMCDPLVINYGGTAASLTDEKFDFDLTMDGIAEKISFTGEGSGFLALDKYGDGSVRNGSQLFGPSMGDGFAELRQYDSDGNSWIDENDEVFSSLMVWSKDKDGNDQCFTLKDLGIGAIYLNHSSTNMTMYGSEGSTNGAMRSTSFVLKDDGSAGTIHHIDLVT